MPAFQAVAADALPPAQLHAAFVAAFADYLLGPFQVTLAQWPQFLARQGVELARSRVAWRDGEVLAFCLTAPRARSWRLGTMGALPAARGSGAGPALLDEFIARAAAEGLPAVELECFAQNPRALRLYEGRGFRAVDALHGYRHDGGHAPPPPAAQPRAVDREAAFAWLEAAERAGCDLPLQVTPPSLRALPVALQAWQQGRAQVVFSQAANGAVTLHSLVDRDAAQDDAFALVGALRARFAGSAFAVPQLQRPALGGAALQRHGFARLPLHQLWMRRPLAA